MTEAEARAKASEIIQRGRVNTLLIAIEEAIASLEAGMAAGALGTLREALHDDKSFYNRALAQREEGIAPQAECGWLIENGKQGDELRYRTIRQGLPAWTDDHNEAIRFARRADAEMFAAEDEDAWRIVEHMWHAKREDVSR